MLAAAASKQTGVSLATLLNFGRNAAGAHFSETLDRSAHFLKHELPIRFAHRAVELDSLPHGLSDCEGIKTVSRWYKQSFAEIRSFPTLRTLDDEARFSVLLTSIYERHNPTIIQIAKGIYQFRRKLGVPLGEPLPEAIEHTTKQFLDIFFTSRVGIRTLIGQHLAMHQPRPYYVGIINTQTRPALTIANAAADAAQLCERRYGDSPKIEVVGARDFSFSYVDSYLHHIAFELLKNSLRATMETHGNSGKLPQIRVILSASNDSEDVTIKISDEGGGIARSGMKRLFSYFYSTAPPQFNDGDDSAVDFSTEQPFAGLGVGLALSRIYCQYWGGELALLSMENYGTVRCQCSRVVLAAGSHCRHSPFLV